ncbi:MAG: hypothetical protein P1U65_16475 [Minwuia sp.]|nr:hypothetical protein [Minwuia sp.]
MAAAVTPERIAHALRYPFDAPHRSYHFSKGQMRAAEPFEPAARHAVVASGSNGAPDRLREKFADTHDVPVTYGTLHDLVPVFAARVTGYGSIPATLAVVPGARAGVHVTWLTDDQLEIMHRTESLGTGYAYCRLDGFAFEPTGAHPQAPLHAYISMHGALVSESGFMPLADISQAAAQRHVMASMQFEGDVESFVTANLSDLAHRGAANLAAAAAGSTLTDPRLVRIA